MGADHYSGHVMCKRQKCKGVTPLWWLLQKVFRGSVKRRSRGEKVTSKLEDKYHIEMDMSLESFRANPCEDNWNEKCASCAR